MKPITYRKTTRERLIELFERIGYKVTRQSTDGTFMLLRYPNGEPTNYWLFSDRIEHRLDDNRGGTYLHYKECLFQLMDGETVCVMGKDNKNLFMQFHNFKSHRESQKEVQS